MTKEMRISIALKDLGVPVNLLGYKYLRYAISLAMDDWDYVDNMCKKTYPAVSKHFDTVPTRVDRAFRHAIETAWLRGNRTTHEMLFGHTVEASKGRPTAGEFIATVADYLLNCAEAPHGA